MKLYYNTIIQSFIFINSICYDSEAVLQYKALSFSAIWLQTSYHSFQKDNYGVLILAEEEEDKKAERGAEFVSTAERGDGLLGAHMHWGVHQRRPLRHGAVEEETTLRQVLDVPRPAASNQALCNVQEAGE